MQETRVWSLGWEDPLETEMANHSSILSWRIPWTEKGMATHSNILAWRIPCKGTLCNSPWCWKESDTTERITLSQRFWRPLKERWVALPSSIYSSKGREGAWGDGEKESWGLCSSHGCIVNFTHCVTLDRSPNLSGFLICENEIKLEPTVQSCYEE